MRGVVIAGAIAALVMSLAAVVTASRLQEQYARPLIFLGVGAFGMAFGAVLDLSFPPSIPTTLAVVILNLSGLATILFSVFMLRRLAASERQRDLNP